MQIFCFSFIFDLQIWYFVLLKNCTAFLESGKIKIRCFLDVLTSRGLIFLLKNCPYPSWFWEAKRGCYLSKLFFVLNFSIIWNAKTPVLLSSFFPPRKQQSLKKCNFFPILKLITILLLVIVITMIEIKIIMSSCVVYILFQNCYC